MTAVPGPIFVLIVNYRTAELAVDCIASLFQDLDALRGGRIVVVDNDSRDDSVEVLSSTIAARGWNESVELLPLPRNGGFAYGNNMALARALQVAPDLAIAVLINPDTVAKPGLVFRLAAYLDTHPLVGIAGAAIESERGDQLVSAHVMPSPLGELEGAASFAPLSRILSRYAVSAAPQNHSHRCDWVSGACMAIRRKVIDDIGTLDEAFFLYYEEVDYCRRAAEVGWQCHLVADARVIHYEGSSTGIAVARRRMPAYWIDSRRRFFLKAYGAVGLIAADLLRAIGRASLLVRRALKLGGRRGLSQEPLRLTRDILVNDARALLSGNWRIRSPRP